MKHPNQVDLGLAICGCHCQFGVPKTHSEIAAYCSFNPTTKKWIGISRQRIQQIEERALRKLRRRPEIQEWIHQLQKHEVHY